MKKEWLLTIGSICVTVIIALALVRWLAPGLLGYAVDQQLVRVDREVPPFYSNIFREEDRASTSYIINDPVLVSRAKPFYPDAIAIGPNDLLGFRNRNVPNHATIITIGDSQTYGNNAFLEQNWPSYLERTLFSDNHGRVYNMSVGAWGGVNYRAILDSALAFGPKAVVVAFYTGNDPFSDTRNALSIDEYRHYLPDDIDVSVADLPDAALRENDSIPVTFDDGVTTVFTPSYRHVSNDRKSPVVRAGYEIMWATAREIHAELTANRIHPVFTIIPTKELAYAAKVEQAGMDLGGEYEALVHDERMNIAELAGRLASLDNAQYIDVLAPLQAAALSSAQIYPDNLNGHPVQPGYEIIGRTIAMNITPASVTTPMGLVGVTNGQEIVGINLITPEGKWEVLSRQVAMDNGWSLSNFPAVSIKETASIPYMGVLTETDPERFGPERLGQND